MSRAMAIRLVLITVWLGSAIAGETLPECGLPNMVPANKRAKITLDGEEMPLGIVQLDWGSARIGSNVLYYLLSEGLGYETEISGKADGSIKAVQMVGGCWEGGADQDSEQCGVTASKHHMTWEVWGGGNLQPLEAFQEERKPDEPKNLGSIGFEAIEGMYMFTGKIDEIYSSTGKPIAYYKSWNFTWNDYSSYFESWQNIDSARMKQCSDSSMFPSDNYKNDMKQYAELVGDWAGVEQVQVGGEMRWKAKCEGGDTGHFWLAPACRAQPTKCIPLISGGSGWHIDVLMQKSAMFDMPFAIGVAASWGDYTSLPRDHSMAQYWWQPDGEFIDLAPVLVEFPASDESAWAQGVKVSNAKGILLMKWAHNQMYKFAQRALDALTSIDLPMQQFEAILLDKRANSLTEDAAACNWLKNNPAIWERWIPDAAACKEGDGVVDTVGNWVVNKSQAVSCAVCPRGKYSTSSGDKLSRQCVDCGPGESSEKQMAECTKCVPGRINANFGAYECSKCALGKFTTDVGGTECSNCGLGYMTIAVGQTQCDACPKGTFKATLETITCESCREGYFSGTFGSTACSSCKEGSIAAEEGMSECMNCSVGTFIDAMQQTECKRCIAGDYSDLPGQSTCTKCVGDFTSEKSAKDSSECFCPKDTYHPEDRSDGVCVSCPAGFSCEGGRVPLGSRRLNSGSMPKHNMPILKEGYYASESEPYKAYFCHEAKSFCLGGPRETYSQQCGGGRFGLQCAACAHGQSSAEGEECVDCTGGPFVWYPLACVCFLIGMALIHRTASSKKGGAFAQLPMFSVMSLIVSQAQYLALLQAYDFSWPPAFRSMLNAIQIFLFDMNVTSVSCYFGYSLAALYLPGLLIPLGVVVVMWVMMFITKITNKVTGGKTAAMQRDYVINTLGLVLTGLSVAVFKSILTIFECRPNPSAGNTMANFDGFKCNGEEVAPLMPFTTTSIVIFILGGMAGYMYVIVKGPHKYHESRSFRIRFQFVLKRWHPRYYWWGALVLVRNLMMCLVSVVSTEGVTQILFLTLIFSPVFFGTLVVKPWRDIVANWTDAILSGAFLFIMFLSAMCAEDTTDSTRSLLGWLMVISMIVAVATVFLIFLDMCLVIIKGNGLWVKGPQITQAMIDDFLNTFGKVYFLEQNGHDEAVSDIKSFLTQLPQAEVQKLLWLTANVQRGLFGDNSVKNRRSMSGISAVSVADASDTRILNTNKRVSERSSPSGEFDDQKKQKSEPQDDELDMATV